MFSTTPITETWTSLNIATPRRTSSSAISCGVVTITPPSSAVPPEADLRPISALRPTLMFTAAIRSGRLTS